MSQVKAYQYPWRYNNRFELLIDGDKYFNSMLDEIRHANTHILLEDYLFESGKTASQFIKELCLAKKRGVAVYIILDEYGSAKLHETDRNTLRDAGIDLLLYNPASILHFSKSLKRDHRKLLVIDQHTAFIGGAGITDAFTPGIKDTYWHDVMLKIQGDIIFDLIDSFNDVWKKQRESLQIFHHETQKVKKQLNRARVLISAGTEKNEIIRSVIKHIRSSKHHIWLTSPYFISSWKVRRALRHAAKRGVDVRLIFPGPHSDHKWVTYGIQRYYQRLLKANVAVYEFLPRFTHAKIILCDDWYTIGSSNLDLWNQFLNLDANIEIYDSESHSQIMDLFKTNFARSHLVLLHKWKARPFIQHTKELIAGILIRVLRAISRKFRR